MARKIVAYRRVANSGACQYCLLLDGAIVKSDTPLPMHPACGCGIEPVFEDGEIGRSRPVGSLRSDIAALPDEVIDMVGASDELKAAISTAADDLSQVLNIRQTPKVVTIENLGAGTGGQFRTLTRSIHMSPDQNSSADAAMSAFHHEFGHFIDFLKAEDTLAARTARKNLVKTLRGSNAGRELRDIRKGLGRKADRDHLTYLLTEDELIARAFQRWMGEQTPAARKAFRAWSDGLPRYDDINVRLADAQGFTNDDFDVIDQAIREWLKAKGWL